MNTFVLTAILVFQSGSPLVGNPQPVLREVHREFVSASSQYQCDKHAAAVHAKLMEREDLRRLIATPQSLIVRCDPLK